MWDERKQIRLQQLGEAETQGALTESEQTELAALIEERCQHEARALEEATRRMEQDNASLEAQVQQVIAQNRALEALIQEQETYLAEVETLVAQMEARRRDWRQQYGQVTGKPLDEPVRTEGWR